MTNRKMLIVDDNTQITSILRDYAVKEGYKPVLAYDGEQAMDLFYKEDPDVILLDVMLPKKDGFQVCREIRQESDVPILMITARSEDYEKIMGLDIGADDYITKPFSPPEVMARVRSIMRRLEKQEINEITHDNLTINIDNYTAHINETIIPLTKKEMELLWVLSKNPQKVFTRDELLDLIWGYDYYGDNRTVDSHIRRLRAKLEEEPHPNWEIGTIWGVGYKFEVGSDEQEN